MLAYDYPLLGAFLTMLWVFLWIMWLFLLFRIIFDIFRDDDLGGWGKALWLLFVLVLPFLGVLIYLIARGSGMGKRDVQQARAAEQDFKAYVQETAGSGGTADELQKLAELKNSGVISDEEFAQQKAKLLT